MIQVFEACWKNLSHDINCLIERLLPVTIFMLCMKSKRSSFAKKWIKQAMLPSSPMHGRQEPIMHIHLYHSLYRRWIFIRQSRSGVCWMSYCTKYCWKDSLSEWKLSDQNLVGVVTDNGTNIVAAIDDLNRTNVYFPYFSHTLQLGIHKAVVLPSIQKALAWCKQLVGHFHHSSKSSYLLKQKQEALHTKQHMLLKGRWNSSYYMVKQILEQQQPICATLLQLKKETLCQMTENFQHLKFLKKLWNS